MNTAHHELLARVASMYYDQEKRQDEIGKELGLSRVKVYRLLKEAKREGVVQIIVRWPIHRDAQLERSLVECFILKEALVLKTDDLATSATRLNDLGRLGAQYLERVLYDGCTLAICLGRATAEVVHAIRPNFHSRVRVAQAVGSIPSAMQAYDGATIGRMLAQKLGGDVLYLSSPLMADSPDAVEVICRQQQVRDTLDAARRADVALVGIGNLDPKQSRIVEAGFLGADELADLITDGAVGDMAGRLFTLNGRLHRTHHNKRVIGITLDDLAHIPATLAVAAGIEKAAAILGALRTRACNVMCTDAATARAVLALANETLHEQRPALAG
jgi:DNA-binding transcriptional regulator LsrR (DeoR family)